MEFRQNSTAMLDNQTEEDMDNEMRTGVLWLSVGIGGGIYICIHIYIYMHIHIHRRTCLEVLVSIQMVCREV